MPATITRWNVFDFFKGLGIKYLQGFILGACNEDALASAVESDTVWCCAGNHGAYWVEFAVQHQEIIAVFKCGDIKRTVWRHLNAARTITIIGGLDGF